MCSENTERPLETSTKAALGAPRPGNVSPSHLRPTQVVSGACARGVRGHETHGSTWPVGMAPRHLRLPSHSLVNIADRHARDPSHGILTVTAEEEEPDSSTHRPDFPLLPFLCSRRDATYKADGPIAQNAGTMLSVMWTDRQVKLLKGKRSLQNISISSYMPVNKAGPRNRTTGWENRIEGLK